MAHVSIENLGKSYGATPVFANLDLDIEHGEFIALLGPSGCGKSTLLRCIAGLEQITAGDIRYDDSSIVELPPSDRGAAMVFQSYALYPHKTVRDNMGFALKIAKQPPEQIAERVEAAARILNITQLLPKRPRELSGGQRQRVAIGRAIVRDPKVFLFDEPLSNLDAELRAKMRVELSRLHRKIDATMIYVTHDQIEAMTMADRIVILHEGKIRQSGTPQEVFDRPADIFVARFIGAPAMNLFPLSRYSELGGVVGGQAQSLGAETLGIRPDELVVGGKATPSSPLVARFEVIESLGRQKLLHGETSLGDEITVSTHDGVAPETGVDLELSFEPGKVHLFDKNGNRCPDGASA